jgi:hypothetical protein
MTHIDPNLKALNLDLDVPRTLRERLYDALWGSLPRRWELYYFSAAVRGMTPEQFLEVKRLPDTLAEVYTRIDDLEIRLDSARGDNAP